VQARKIRILAVDHNPLLREGLALSIQLQPDMELVGAVASGKEAVQSFTQHRPDVTLMDLDLPSGAGITAVKEILKVDPAAAFSDYSPTRRTNPAHTHCVPVPEVASRKTG
jgi:DNA-binding NarL/FixJ family response regulator